MGATADTWDVIAAGTIIGGTFSLEGSYNCTGEKTGPGTYRITLTTAATLDNVGVALTNLAEDQSHRLIHVSDYIKEIRVRKIDISPFGFDGDISFLLFRRI